MAVRTVGRVAAGRCSDPATEYRDAGPFIRAHERRLLQDLGQVAVTTRVPADDRLKRNSINALMHGCRALVGLIRVVLRVVEVGYTFNCLSVGVAFLVVFLVLLVGWLCFGV